MRNLILNYGVSKGADTNGQPTANLYEYGRRIATARGKGDLRGEVIKRFLSEQYPDRFPDAREITGTFDVLKLRAQAAGLDVDLLSSSTARDVIAVSDREVKA